MTSHAAIAPRSDGRLWAAALGLSLLCNAAILLVAGLAVIQSQQYQHPNVAPAAPAETVRIIAPELADQAAAPATAAATDAAAEGPAAAVAARDPEFARTADDQRSRRPDKPAFIGERDTQATSDATPDPNAAAMPAQAGIQSRHEGDIETTESRYQDGVLSDAAATVAESPQPPGAPAPPAPEMAPAPPAVANRGEPTATPGVDEKLAPPPAAGHWVEGPNPVDVAVPLTSEEGTPKGVAQTMPREGTPEALPTPDEVKASPAAASPQEMPKQPSFRGNQRKTTIQGSISRTGRSALDVEDTPLGRYQATLSRAIELEWQRNCVRYRDFITPGYLTVRFFVDAKGKVRNVQFVGAMQTGQQQKGFTLNSIHDAVIPAMPPEVRKDFVKDPLELIFNFYF
ncbi:MAG: hypothetical protein WCP45_12270 [Verrucomicrobiota bacterium]